jgi:hypothetical protein
MGAIFIMILVAFVVSLISLSPKGSNYNQKMYFKSLKDFKKIIIKKGL